MRRLLMGDVGTGKTLVALYALVTCAASDSQAAMMAPTEVLAQQFARKMGPLLDILGIRWGLLTGSTPRAERAALLAALADGNLTVLFGTHALLEPDVVFARLTLVVIDEQHRFGVRQRQTLTEKGAHPDVLVMSATPIPRTLSATAYGDLASSVLRMRPVEGAGVTTHVIKPHQLHKAHAAVHAALAAGHQAYVICALVDESDESDLKAALRTAEELRAGAYADVRVGLITGKMRPAEKNEAMERFAHGELDVLVATTVVEVGVDVPNATEMIILNAERYGIAQIHQLRGRVGRGSTAGEVWLVSSSFASEARARFDTLVATRDGFAIAEFDLHQRGPGEVLGTRQHGVLDFKIADLIDDADLVDAARHDAFALIARDPELTEDAHALLSEECLRCERALREAVRAG